MSHKNGKFNFGLETLINTSVKMKNVFIFKGHKIDVNVQIIAFNLNICLHFVFHQTIEMYWQSIERVSISVQMNNPHPYL